MLDVSLIGAAGAAVAFQCDQVLFGGHLTNHLAHLVARLLA